MATCRCRPQPGKIRERGPNWTAEPRYWSAEIKTVLQEVRRYVQKSCDPGPAEKKRLRRLAARVSQLPLAETRKLLTVQRISDTSYQQLVQRQLLLYGLRRSGMNRPQWCRLWHPRPVVYLRAKEWACSHLGAFRPCEPDQMARIIINKVQIKVTLNKVIAGAFYIVTMWRSRDDHTSHHYLPVHSNFSENFGEWRATLYRKWTVRSTGWDN